MRWKILFAFSFAWLVLGIIGLHAGELSGKSPLLWVVIGPASLELSICQCVDRSFVDAVHGPPFLTIPGVILVYLSPSVLLIWLALYKLRRAVSQRARQKEVRRWPYALAGALPLLVIGADVFPWIYRSPTPAIGSVRHGDYLVEPPRPCRPSTPANTHRLFYKGRLVTSVALEVAFSPLNPSRLLYETATWCTDEPAATFYFDGNREAPVKVFGEWQEGAELFWSPDDRFVVSSSYSLVLVNLQTAQSSDLSSFFVGKGISDSHPGFRGWSPDGKTVALANSSSYRREDGSDFSVTDLVSLNPATANDSYVASMRKREGWGAGEFKWVAKDGTYDLVVDPSVENAVTVCRRPEHQRTTDLGGEVTLAETVRGFPGETEEVVIHQTVRHKGSVVWEARYTTYDMSVSPDHHYLLVWNNVNKFEPWRVYDLSTGKHVVAQQAVSESGPFPYKFGRWADDSRSVLVASDAYEAAIDANGREKPDHQLVPYRQTFLIDPLNGSLHKQHHCQQPDNPNVTSSIDATVNWDNTPCAGRYGG